MTEGKSSPKRKAFLFSALLAEVSMQAIRLAVLSRADRLGGSTSAVALVLFAEAFIALVVGILGGPLLDRYDPRWAGIAANLWRAGTTVALLWVDGFVPLIIVVGLFALGDGLYVPARSALVVRLAGDDGVLALNAKVGAAQGLALVLGPVLWAAANHLGGPDVVLWSLGAGFTLSGLLLMSLEALAPNAEALGYLQELRAGLSFVSQSQVVRFGLFLFGLAVLLAGGFYPLLPEIAKLNAPQNPESALGAMVVGVGVGGILGAGIAPMIISRLGRGVVSLLTVILDGVFFAGLSVHWGIWGVALWMFGWGVVVLVSLIAFTTLFQEESPFALRGRVLALLPPLQGVGTALAFAIIAISARGLRTDQITLMGGLGLVGLAIVLWVLPIGRLFSKSGRRGMGNGE